MAMICRNDRVQVLDKSTFGQSHFSIAQCNNVPLGLSIPNDIECNAEYNPYEIVILFRTAWHELQMLRKSKHVLSHESRD